MKTYSASDARQNFADVFDEAFYKGPVIVTKNRKRVAVVSLALLNRLLKQETADDLRRANAALAEYEELGGTSLDDLKEELGLSDKA